MENFDIELLTQQCKNDTQLFGIMFVLLSKCNHDCVHCYIPGHCSDGLPKEIIFRVIDEARALGALNVTFTGGEILLRKDLLELISYARSKHMRVFLMSNGYALDEEYVRKLADLYISEFSTTVYSLNAKIHDKITRVEGSLKKTLGNISLLKKYNIDITVKTPLMEDNKYEYREVEKYARENGFAYRTTPTIFSKTNGDTEPHDFQICSDLDTIVRETDRVNEQYRGELISRNDGGIPCSAGHSNICINFDGTVWPCNTLTLNVGNIWTQSLRDIWMSSKELIDWRKLCTQVPEKCASCELHSWCIRCPGLAYMEDKDLYGCSSSAKRIAEVRKGVNDA
ncbi:MAG: radical SAM protein [Ruminococcaceae bacterium]|nr:radical SAM protein [Oscillospiraceae bacterium]